MRTNPETSSLVGGISGGRYICRCEPSSVRPSHTCIPPSRGAKSLRAFNQFCPFLVGVETLTCHQQCQKKREREATRHQYALAMVSVKPRTTSWPHIVSRISVCEACGMMLSHDECWFPGIGSLLCLPANALWRYKGTRVGVRTLPDALESWSSFAPSRTFRFSRLRACTWGM
jgi:hypothetical protein